MYTFLHTQSSEWVVWNPYGCSIANAVFPPYLGIQLKSCAILLLQTLIRCFVHVLSYPICTGVVFFEYQLNLTKRGRLVSLSTLATMAEVPLSRLRPLTLCVAQGGFWQSDEQDSIASKLTISQYSVAPNISMRNTVAGKNAFVRRILIAAIVLLGNSPPPFTPTTSVFPRSTWFRLVKLN